MKFSCYVVNAPDTINVAQAFKEQLAEGGLEMDLELLEFGTALAKYNNKEHTCFQIGWSGRPDPDGNVYGFLHSKGGLNSDQYANRQWMPPSKRRAPFTISAAQSHVQRSHQNRRHRRRDHLSLLAP